MIIKFNLDPPNEATRIVLTMETYYKGVSFRRNNNNFVRIVIEIIVLTIFFHKLDFIHKYNIVISKQCTISAILLQLFLVH